jgi:hypothetical protein
VVDGLDSNQRHRGHFITNIDVDDQRFTIARQGWMHTGWTY